MRDSIPLGRIAGIRIGANWSVLAIVAVITFVLATQVFPQAVPDLSWVAYAAAGLGSALVFLLSLLAHEISHAVVARRNGIRVEGITLWLLGGVAKLGGEADTPGADLRIAGVGPLVSAVLGGFFFVASELAGIATGTSLVTAALGFLAVINVILAVFNLVPAAPLDGGRLLRSALWRRSGDRHRAAITAARAGRAFGFGLIGVGIVELIVLPGISGVWLALVGWFLITAARAEQQHARQQSKLAGVRVADVMSPDPFTAPARLTVEQFGEEYAAQYRFSAFPVTDSAGTFTGLVTLERLQAVPRDDRAGVRLADIAFSPEEVPTTGRDEALIELLSRKSGSARGRIVVLDHDRRVVGIVSPTDISRAMQAGTGWGPGQPSRA